MNTLYPIFLKLSEKPVLVVGGGAVALRRVERLLEAGARVKLVSPSAVDGVRALADAGRLEWKSRAFEPADLDGAALVFLAAGDPGLVRQVREGTVRRGILLSAAEDESFSDFHVPAVAAQGDVKVAVSTGGASPAGAAKIRDEIEAWLSRNGDLLAEALAQGRTARAPTDTARRGKVYLVGAGPGDPGLLTVRAAELLASADVVLYDRLVPDAILERIPTRAEKLYVGKEAGCPLQADVEKLLIESARAGKAVVRLKGGDPLVFGRGGEEMLALARAGVDFEIVSGVSALSSVPAAAGIPVTMRGVSSEIVVRSGHSREESGGAAGASGGTTYIYFMAAGRLAQVADELLAQGLPDSTPVAVIQRGTMPGQRTLAATLGTLADAAARETIETPALLVAGEVVRCREGIESLLAPLLFQSSRSEGEATE